MADTSLKALTSVVFQMAEDTRKDIKPDVKDIKNALVGTEGILNTLYTIRDSITNLNKKNDITRLSENKNKNQNRLLKNTNSITSLLGKILNSVNSISKGKGGGRLSGNRIERAERSERSSKERLNGLESVSKSIEVVERLKNIKLKDFIFTKRKLKNLGKIMSRSLSIFRSFKNQKEVDGTIGLINSSIEILKKLSKINAISIPAKLGVKTIEKILIGSKKKPGSGLLGLFRTISKHGVQIKKAQIGAKQMLATCGSFLLMSIILVGIAALSVPAMLGALLMKGVVWLLVGTFKFLSKSAVHIVKGSVAFLIMSSSIIAFGLGLAITAKAVKDMKLKDVGILLASIVGVGLAVAGIGLLAVPIAIGSATLLLMGASLSLFGLSLLGWRNFDATKSMENIDIAVSGLRKTFGLELGKSDEKKSFKERLTGGLGTIAMGILNFGSSFFVMGSLLLTGFALGLLYGGLKPWVNFTGAQKAANNIEIAVGALKSAFGIGEVKGDNEAKLSGLGGNLLDLASSLLQGGKAFIQIGVLTLATAMMDAIRIGLIPWQNYNATDAANNIEIAVKGLKSAFGLDDREFEAPKGKLTGLGTDLITLGSSLLQMGSTVAKIGTLVLATGLMDTVRLALLPWNDYNSKPAIDNIRNTVDGLLDVFGLSAIKREKKEIEEVSQSKSIWERIGNGAKKLLEAPKAIASSLADMATSAAEGGAAMAKISNILQTTSIMDVVKTAMRPWDTFDPSKAITNMSRAMSSIDILFLKAKHIRDYESSDSKTTNSKYFKISAENIKKGLISLSEGWSKSAILKSAYIPFEKTVKTVNSLDIEKASILIDLFKSFNKINDKPFDKFTKSVNEFSKSCADLITALDNFNKNYSVEDNGEGEGSTISKNENVNINNTEALAKAIAEAIGSLPINVETNLSDIRLVVNNEVGRRVVLTLDN